MKISARSHDLRTKCSEVPASWPRAKYFPNRLDQSLSISISSYDQMLKFRNFCFNLNRTYLPLKWRARTWKLPKRLYNTKKKHKQTTFRCFSSICRFIYNFWPSTTMESVKENTFFSVPVISISMCLQSSRLCAVCSVNLCPIAISQASSSFREPVIFRIIKR